MATEEYERYKNMISYAVLQQGLTVERWEDDEEEQGRPKAVLGKFTPFEDDDEAGAYVGEEGIMTVTVVGAAKYNNERAYFAFIPDGMDEAMSETEPSNYEYIGRADGDEPPPLT